MLAGSVVVFAVVVAVAVTAIAVVGVVAVDVAAAVAVVVTAAATAPAGAVGGMVVPVLLAIWLTSLAMELTLAMESDWCICGLLECKIFVNPPPVNEPFGESLVTTTDGARTRRGLKIADTSLSRVIVVRALSLIHTYARTHA